MNGPKDDECGQVSTRTARPRPAHMSEVISTPDSEFTVFRGGETEYKFRCLGFCSNLAESILNGSIDVDKIVGDQAEAADLKKAAADFNDAVDEAGYKESLELLLGFTKKYGVELPSEKGEIFIDQLE